MKRCTECKGIYPDDMSTCPSCGSSKENTINIKSQAEREYETQQVKCPKCGSTQFHSSDKGFSVGKAIVGTALTGGIGMLAGLHGSKKVVLTCLKCGKKWDV